jgi:hypothetical protein
MRRLNLIRVHQMKAFINCWRLFQQWHAPSIHPLEIAAALEEVAQEIRREEALKADEYKDQ